MSDPVTRLLQYVPSKGPVSKPRKQLWSAGMRTRWTYVVHVHVNTKLFSETDLNACRALVPELDLFFDERSGVLSWVNK